jgi:hypothetical protein
LEGYAKLYKRLQIFFSLCHAVAAGIIASE